MSQHVPNTTRTHTHTPNFKAQANTNPFSLAKLYSYAFDTLKNVLSLPLHLPSTPVSSFLRRFLLTCGLPEPDAEALTSYQHCMLHCVHPTLKLKTAACSCMCNDHQFSHRVLPCHLLPLQIFFASSSSYSVRNPATCHVDRLMWWSMSHCFGRGREGGSKCFFEMEKEVKQKCVATHSNHRPKQVPTLLCRIRPLWWP